MKPRKEDPPGLKDRETDRPSVRTTESGPAREGGAFSSKAPLDLSVLQGVRNRDPDALGAFFEHYFDRVYALAFRLLGDHASAEDAVQDVFYKVHRAADRLDTSRDPGPWLVTITLNTCRSLWRSASYKMSVRSVDVEPPSGGAPGVADPARDPEERLMSAERERQVQDAVGRLPEGLKTVVLLRDYQGLDHREIAEILRISHDAVRKRYSRALSELGKSLQGILE